MRCDIFGARAAPGSPLLPLPRETPLLRMLGAVPGLPPLTFPPPPLLLVDLLRFGRSFQAFMPQSKSSFATSALLSDANTIPAKPQPPTRNQPVSSSKEILSLTKPVKSG